MHQEATRNPKALEIKIVTYNVESMSMDRMRQITTSMRKDKYNVALLQGTRWNLDCGMWSNGYKLYSAPAGKTSTEAHAGVSIIIDELLLTNTKVTQTIIHEHRTMVVRLHNLN